jgi:murein DD-endopeptidase MepM/ murein hydrolase activator NlpD
MIVGARPMGECFFKKYCGVWLGCVPLPPLYTKRNFIRASTAAYFRRCFAQKHTRMAKEKFVFNIHTLRFEKVEISLKSKLIRAFGISAGLAVFFVLSGMVYSRLVPSTNEMVLRREMEKMKEEYKLLNNELHIMATALDNVHARDRDLYRMLLDNKSYDEELWNAGTGGSEKYEYYKNLGEGELLAKTREKINKLRYQIALQTQSHNEILESFKKSEDRLESIPSIKPIREDRLKKSMTFLSGFGWRVHPVLKTAKMHTGIDFGAPPGTPIYATGKGTVVRIEYKNSGYGHNVVISHGYGYETLYGHMDKISVKPGQQVFKGQQIGTVGSTGMSTGPHLHYEVIKDGEKVNPMHFCLDGLTPAEFQEFVERASETTRSFDYYNEWSGN